MQTKVPIYCPYCSKPYSWVQLKYEKITFSFTIPSPHGLYYCPECGFGIRTDNLFETIVEDFDPSYRNELKRTLIGIEIIGRKNIGNLANPFQTKRETKGT